MKPSKTIGIAMTWFIALAFTGSTSQQTPQPPVVIHDTSFYEKAAIIDSIHKQVVTSISEVKQEQKTTIVKLNNFNYWFTKFVKLYRARVDKPSANNSTEYSYLPSAPIIKIIKDTQRVYGGTPPRELSELEKTDGNFFKGLKPFVRKIFKRNEN